MDKEDCIQVLLSTLQQPLWKSCDSVTDWDLKNVLWKAGLLLTPEQVAALFADMKRRGLISASDRRNEDRIVALWNVKIASAGEDWLAQRGLAEPRQSTGAQPQGTPSSGEMSPNEVSDLLGETELPSAPDQPQPLNSSEPPRGIDVDEDASLPFRP